MVELRFTTLSARDLHWRNPRKKIIESAAIWKARVSVHSQAQCHAKWPRSGRGFQQESNSSRPTLCNQSQPLSHWFVSIARKKRCMTRHISPPATEFLAYKTVVLGFFKLNIKARHEIREFLNAYHWSIHLIAFDIDWSWNILYFAQFLLNAHTH